MPSSNFRDVNASVSVSGSDGAILDGANSAIKATVKDLTNSNPLTVAVTDANGDQITSFGGGTQYTEGDTDATITGTAALVEGAANALVPMTQPLTDTQLRATPVPVSGTFYQATQPVSIASAVPVTDNAGSLTVDAPVGTPVFVRLSDGAAAITTLPVSLATNTPTLQANSGVDIGDVTINNASGAAAVNIQDGGNSITVDGTITANLAAGTNNIGDVDVLTINGVAPAFGSGVRGATVQRVTIATDDVVPASQSGTWTVQPGNTANTTPWLVSKRPATTGGLSKFHLVGAATTNATNVKASAGQVYVITAFNIAATPAYLKFHNTAGTPTAGSGVTDTFLIPGNTAGAGVIIPIDHGIAFSTGIGITITAGIADANTTAIAADNVVVNIYYA